MFSVQQTGYPCSHSVDVAAIQNKRGGGATKTSQLKN